MALEPSVTGELGEGRVRWEGRQPFGDGSLQASPEEGSGFVWGAGVGLDLRAYPACRWSVGLGYHLFEAEGFDFDEFGFVDFFGPRLIVSEGELDFRRQRAEATVGYSTPSGRATFALGYRRARYEADLETSATLGGLRASRRE